MLEEFKTHQRLRIPEVWKMWQLLTTAAYVGAVKMHFTGLTLVF